MKMKRKDKSRIINKDKKTAFSNTTLNNNQLHYFKWR